VVVLLPGTYGTALVRNHAMQGVLAEMESEGLPAQVIESLKDALDCNLYLFDKQIELPVMYGVLGGSVLLLVLLYILLNACKKKI